MEHILTAKEHKRMTEEYDKVKYRCRCGHRVVISNNKLKVTCNWCYRNVYKNKKDEFKDKMENMLCKKK